MARNQGKNFVQAHWDWLVAAAGILIAGVSYFLNYQMTEVKKTAAMGTGVGDEVAAVDLGAPAETLKRFEHPAQLAPVDAKGSFLASHARVFCTPADGSVGCGEVLLPDVETCTNPLCKKEQKEDREKLVLDADEDGMPDEYEKANGLNPEADDREEDLDGDGFTNFEEFEAGTRPNDALDHPDYFETKKDIARIVGLGEPITSSLQFLGRSPYQLAKGYRFSFYDPEIARTRKNLGTYEMTAFLGEEIQLEVSSSTGKKLKPISTGFILEKYDHKVERVTAKGVSGTIEEDHSTVTLKRISDGVEFEFGLGSKAKPRKTVLDAKVKVEFAGLRDVSVFDVGKGDKIDLTKYGVTYTVVKIGLPSGDRKTLSVTLKNDVTGKTKVLVSE